MAEAKKEISAMIKEKYKMNGNHQPGVFHFKKLKIDLTNCTLAQADAMVEKGFDIIVPISKDKPVVK